MSDRSKKIFFALTIIVPFLVYCFYYYGMMIKNAPYRFSDFDSITFAYGPVDSLVNRYDSKTGDYQYVDRRDSLVKMHLRLTNDDLLYLHRKAADLGFWDFPVKELADSTHGKNKSIRYIIEFKYKKKSKRVVFDTEYAGDVRLIDANKTLIKEIRQSLYTAEERLKK
ncbi:hypothetical protein SNE25_16890 [Mucilaginibacter sabulilitoris]|uniref:Uncharacterized protein n=1 Tax=Mucilaginibacter sabulilitoris TaxID=1173583 RepID=A0ABZ0TEZ9_9SPHI|nr:hypothetical protein [Mucilaginibacter sabulilitoris]WPU90997.1 hypothetical protein SNE25_16890 [Mucilaginibacter sabulilitoris]